MTHAEHVEKMAERLRSARIAYFHRVESKPWGALDADDRGAWLAAARVALAQHPAVEALRQCSESLALLESRDPAPDGWDLIRTRLSRARSLLASLGKDGG